MFKRLRGQVARYFKKIAVHRPTTAERILEVAKSLDAVAVLEGNSEQSNCAKHVEGLLGAGEWVIAIHSLETTIGELDDVPQPLIEEVAALHRENSAAIAELLGE